MKLLAVDRLLEGAELNEMKKHLKDEAHMAWDLHKAGILRELYFKESQPPGAVFIMECDSIDQARHILSELPLVKANLVAYDLYPLSYFKPFEFLKRDVE